MLLMNMPRKEAEKVIRSNKELQNMIREIALDEAMFMEREALKCFNYGTNKYTYDDKAPRKIHIEPIYWGDFIDGYLSLNDEIPYFTDSECVYLLEETDGLIDTYDIASHGGHISDSEYEALEDTIINNISVVADNLEGKINELYSECYDVDYLVEYYDNCYYLEPLCNVSVDKLGKLRF